MKKDLAVSNLFFIFVLSITNTMARIKVRFNLGRGINYMKWKVTYPDGSVEYYNPTETQLVLKGTQLKNHKSVAKKIYEGGEKVVCAWILCDEIEVLTYNFNQSDFEGEQLRYNPRVQPNWMLNGIIVDDARFSRIESVDFKLYKMW